MNSLKNCPFCNNDVCMTTHVKDTKYNSDKISYEISCELCGVTMQRYIGYSNDTLFTINEMVERWNNRV